MKNKGTMNQRASFDSSILKNSNVNLNKTPAINQNYKHVTFSPTISVRSFKIGTNEETIWENTCEVIDSGESNASEEGKEYEQGKSERKRKILQRDNSDDNLLAEIRVTENPRKLSKSINRTNDSGKTVESQIFEIEKVLGRRIRKGKPEYLIKWLRFSSKHNSWEPESNLSESLVDELNKILNLTQ